MHNVKVSHSGVSSMEQMEQLLPRTAKDHFSNSCRSDEIFCLAGVGVPVCSCLLSSATEPRTSTACK